MLFKPRGFGNSPQPKPSKCKKVAGSFWYMCVTKKFTCSLWLLLLLTFLMAYILVNYVSIDLSGIFIGISNMVIPSSSSTEVSSSMSKNSPNAYLNPISLHSLGKGFGNCPYTNPSYPSIGDGQSYVCPNTKPYHRSITWHLKDMNPSSSDPSVQSEQNNAKNKKINKHDVQAYNALIDSINSMQNVIQEHSKEHAQLISIALTPIDSLYMTYQYLSCQSNDEFGILSQGYNGIITDSAEYASIFKKYGFKSWSDAKICFDRVVCMNDQNDGTVSYNLYLNYKSQEMMRALIDKTQEIEKEDQYSIELSFDRNSNQQAFHINIAYIHSNEHRMVIDHEALMDDINNEIGSGKGLQCVKLQNAPVLDSFSLFNSKKLMNNYQFEWTSNDNHNPAQQQQKQVDTVVISDPIVQNPQMQ